MRTFGALVAGVIAVVAMLVTVPTLWVSTHVVDEDGYVSLSGQLASDDELQGAFAAYLSNEFASRGVLPARLEQAATKALTQVAGRTTNEPGFVEAFEKTQRTFHDSAFADDGSGPLRVDVGPMAQFVATRVSNSLPVTLTVPKDLVVPVGDAQDREDIKTIKKSTPVSRAALAVAVIAAIGSIALARRRSIAIAWLGIGGAVVAGMLWLASNLAAPKVLDHVDAPSEFARTLQKLLVDRATDSLDVWLLWLGAAGAVLAVGGLIARASVGSSD